MAKQAQNTNGNSKGSKGKALPKAAEARGGLRVCVPDGAKPIAVPVPRDLAGKQQTPDGETFGKKTGLRVVHFVDAMFRANDKAHADDGSLAATLNAEFPKRAVLQAVSAYRAYHNAGKHGCGDGQHHAATYRADGTVRGNDAATPPKGKGKAGAKKAAKKAPAKKAAAK